MGHTHQISSEEGLLVRDLLDLSVAELLILQFMLRFQTPILRKVLLETLNHTMGEEKSISSSSFYNMTKKLSERGLIVSVDKKEILATPKARDVIRTINRLTAIASIDGMQLIEEMLPKFAQVANLKPGGRDRQLIINLESGMDIRMTHAIASFAQRSFIASDDLAYQSYLDRGMPTNIEQTKLDKHDEKMIRERDEYFDAVILLGFDCNKNYRDIPTQQWMEESERVLAPGGLIIASSTEDLPVTNHFLADGLIENIRDSELMGNVGREQLIEEMNKIGIDDAAIFAHKGLLIGWGHKQSTER